MESNLLHLPNVDTGHPVHKRNESFVKLPLRDSGWYLRNIKKKKNNITRKHARRNSYTMSCCRTHTGTRVSNRSNPPFVCGKIKNLIENTFFTLS